MSDFELVIGDKAFSSWSLRPWLLLRQADIPFAETRIRLRQPETRADALAHAPSGKVPVLKHGGLVIWDSLAICEYVAEMAPERGLWPEDSAIRARARSIVAEMHSGFPDLRRELGMDVLARHPRPELGEGAARDVLRVQEVWRDCLDAGPGGPFLFGDFSVADAFYAPVVTRFVTYEIPMTGRVREYADRIMTLPAMAEWCEGARVEAGENRDQGQTQGQTQG